MLVCNLTLVAYSIVFHISTSCQFFFSSYHMFKQLFYPKKYVLELLGFLLFSLEITLRVNMQTYDCWREDDFLKFLLCSDEIIPRFWSSLTASVCRYFITWTRPRVQIYKLDKHRVLKVYKLMKRSQNSKIQMDLGLGSWLRVACIKELHRWTQKLYSNYKVRPIQSNRFVRYWGWEKNSWD